MNKQHIQSVTIRNFKGIRNEKIDIRGHNVYAFGRNAMGKTSFLDAIFKILSGKDLPSKPTTTGERMGNVSIELDDLVITAKFNEKNEKIAIEITNKQGQTYKSPRTELNQIIGAIDFDINKFFELSAAKQTEQIKLISGIDFTDIDAEYKEKYDERTFISRKVKDLEAQQKVFDKNNVTPADLTAMTAAISQKREHNQEIKDVGQRMHDRGKEIARNNEEIENLQKQIADLKTKNEGLDDLNQQALKWFVTPEGKMYDIETEESAFNKAIEDNKMVAANIENQKLYLEFIAELEKEKLLNERIDEIKAIKQRLIKESDMPVPGLSFDENGLTYHGLPFEAAQINKAQQIIIGLQIQLALLGDIRIARFEGSLIDNENMEYIEDWAKKRGLQLFVEMVDRDATELRIEVKEIL